MSPQALYEERRARFTAAAEGLDRRSSAFSYARLVAALALAACLFMIVLRASGDVRPWVLLAVVAALVLAVLVALHGRLLKRQRHHEQLARINGEALARLARDFDALPLPPLPDGLGQRSHAARDLDLFGPASLFHLLGTAHTPPGKTTLARWLLTPAPPQEIGRRQQAVGELAGELELRQQLELRARQLEEVDPDPERFLAWAEAEPLLSPRPAAVWLSRVLALASLGLLAAAVAGAAPWSVWGLLALGNLAFAYFAGSGLDRLFFAAESGEHGFLAYAGAFELVAGRGYQSALLRRLAAELDDDAQPAGRRRVVRAPAAVEQLRRLHGLNGLADVRHSAPFHFVLQAVVLWDFHVAWLLERWQRGPGRHARRWLGALGRFEALAALGTLAHDHPQWALPEVETGRPALAARALGHPLLPEERRVANDVTIGPAGTFLLVTGSNMAGKSTLLRAVGVNVVLAQTGGPVCAAELALPPVQLATSVLIEDSLTSGLSFFMAELRRIQQIVQRARACRAEGRTLLYLLDEVLRGTNAAERRLAIEQILLHLIEQGALGAVSTHDLEIARLERLAPRAQPVHFRETVHPEAEGGPLMTFDYRLRPGLATTTNALKLLELLGLGEAGDGGAEDAGGSGEPEQGPAEPGGDGDREAGAQPLR